MTDITINATSVSVEYSISNKKVEINIAEIDVKEVIKEIGLHSTIMACDPSDVLSNIAFADIKSYIESEGYTIAERR